MGQHLGTQKSIRFTAEELKELEAAVLIHGSIKAAVMAGIRNINRSGPRDWPTELRRLAEELEERRG